MNIPADYLPEVVVVIGSFFLSLAACCFLSKKMGREPIVWFVLGIIFPYISLIILFFLPDINKNKTENHKKCGIKDNSSDDGNKNLEHYYSKIEGPRKPLFIDVETTGLHSNDKIVSICMILFDCDSGVPSSERNIKQRSFKFKFVNFIFDPCKKSHKIAESIHGYNDWILRHQQLFIEKIDEIRSLILQCDAIVAHNAKFDISFIKREFAECGVELPERKIICTMEEAIGAKSLASCASSLGIFREKSIHDASEDTKMCLCLYLSKRSGINVKELYKSLSLPLQNYIDVPPFDGEILPRRNNVMKKKEVLSKLSQKQLLIKS